MLPPRDWTEDERDEAIGEHVAAIRYACDGLPIGAIVRRRRGRVLLG